MGIFATLFAVIILAIISDEEKTESSEIVITEKSETDVLMRTNNWLTQNTPTLVGEYKTQSSWKQAIGDPFVMKDGSVYKMWFGAHIFDVCYSIVIIV